MTYICYLVCCLPSPHVPFVPRALQLFECLVASTAAMVQQNEDAEAELRELSRGGCNSW